MRTAVPARGMVAADQDLGSSVADGANAGVASAGGSGFDDAAAKESKAVVSQVSKPRGKGRRRRCIPSWDDIIFGGR